MVDLTGIDALVPAFPVRPNVVAGSAARRTDGRIIYCYADGGVLDPSDDLPPIIPGQIRERSFQTAHDLGHGVRQQPYHVWRTGVAIPGSDQPIIEDSRAGACSVWREGGQLYLSATYADTAGESGFRRSEVWVSPSGNGGDWSKAGDIQSPLPITGFPGEASRDAGTGMGYHGVLPMMAWIEEGLGLPLNWKRPTVYSGSGASWSKDYEQGYYIGGAYGSAVSRRVVEHAGQLWWLSSGNVRPNPDHGLTGDLGFAGGPGAWSPFTDQPQRVEWYMPYITSHLNQMLRVGAATRSAQVASPRIEATPNPATGGWEAVTAPLHMGDIRPGGNWGALIGDIGSSRHWAWCDGIGPLGAMVNGDKVWLPMGGWLLGALGRS